MWEKTKSAAVIVFITILIWFAADQNVREEQIFPVRVRLTSVDPAERYASFADPPYEATILVKLQARRRRLSEFREKVAARTVFEAEIDRETQLSPTPRLMSSLDILARIKVLSDFRPNMVDPEPAAVAVLVDEFETVRDIRVEPVYGGLRVTAIATPQRVSVRLPRFLADKLRADPVAIADAQQRIRAVGKPDGGFEVQVPLVLRALEDLPPGVRIQILPSEEVVINGQIEALTATRRKGPVQITWSIPDQVQRDFRIVPDPDANFRPDIDVTGPRDLIDQLDPREIRGFVEVMAADTEKPGTKIRRAAQFVLPPEFTLAAGSQPYELVFHLEPLPDKAEPSEE